MTKTTAKDAEPGPRRGRPPMSTLGRRRMLVVSVPPELDDQVRELVAREGRPLAWVARELLRLGLRHYRRKLP